ncbi:MAG TPA: 50S ribosomal protein L9 [Candidatus Polarisedimenticolia bacterium]|jgi:large subunit ribosomal protein L9|nr:50S ribosomal protein L9 [Candidatus Polarisedimenticolia bacterium]
MRVVLREDIDKLGRRGEVHEVAAGYARNFLLPKGKALPATDGNMKRVEQERRRYAVLQAKEKEDAAAVGRRIAGVSCTIVRKVGENDQLYGSVTASDIAEYLEKEGIAIDKRRILLEEPIKALGIYTVPVKLHADVQGEVRVWVVKE